MVFPIYTKTECLGRALLLAFSCDPHQSMEERNGWNRALQAAARFETVVLCGPHCNQKILENSTPADLRDRLRFIQVPLSDAVVSQLDRDLYFYRAYRQWTIETKRLAVELNNEKPFDFAHLVTLCGYREPGTFSDMPLPFVLGPIGGTSGFPLAYLGIGDFVGGLYELSRNVLNFFQRNFSKRISNVLSQSAMVIAANSSTRGHLGKFLKYPMPVMLETGIDFPINPLRVPRDTSRPLRILWTGRLRMWKGLPILLHAIARLPGDVPIQLRVLGEGCCLSRWKRLAQKIGVEDRVEWVGRPSYRESMIHYQWADVFAFTSLRDTSGTGLLESLAAGVPIIGLNHQGAADILTDDCGIKISVKSPKVSIEEFSSAITKLSRDAAELHRLSLGASARAQEYCWSKYSQPMYDIYVNCIQSKKLKERTIDRSVKSNGLHVSHKEHYEGAL